MNPVVSVCIPAFNAGPYFGQAIESVIVQTFSDWELVVVDNASTDGTYEIAQEYARRDARVKVHRNSGNIGPHNNFNQCIDRARGEWIKWLCADDWLEASCLEQMLAVHRPGVLLIVCREDLAFEPTVPESEITKHLKYWSDHTLLPRRFPGQSFIPAEAFANLVAEDPTFNCIGAPNATMFHRRAFEQFGRRNPDLTTHDDWELAMRVGVHQGLCYVDEPLAHFRQHDASLSTTVFAARRFRMEVISPLIIRDAVAYADVYEPVRRAAMRHEPPIDLVVALFDAVREAKVRARELSDESGNRDCEAEWDRFLQQYPRLAGIPNRYYLTKAGYRIKRAFQRTSALNA